MPDPTQDGLNEKRLQTEESIQNSQENTAIEEPNQQEEPAQTPQQPLEGEQAQGEQAQAEQAQAEVSDDPFAHLYAKVSRSSTRNPRTRVEQRAKEEEKAPLSPIPEDVEDFDFGRVSTKRTENPYEFAEEEDIYSEIDLRNVESTPGDSLEQDSEESAPPVPPKRNVENLDNSSNYLLDNGDDAIEFEEGSGWYGIRMAVKNGETIDRQDLVTEGPVREVCDKIIESKGRLSKAEVKSIVQALNNNAEEIRDQIGEPLLVEVEDFPNTGIKSTITTLLHIAYAFNVNPDIIKAIEDIQPENTYRTLDFECNLPAHYAARYCSGKMLDDCLSKTGDDIINTRNFRGETPLHVLARNPLCSEKELNAALHNRLELDVADMNGKLPIHCFARNAKGGVIKAVVAAMNNDPELKEQISALDGNGRNMLHHMACNTVITGKDLREIARSTDVDIEQKDSLSKTPIGYAVTSHSGSLISSFVKLNADINARDATGRTPLHYAVISNDKGAVRKVLKHPNVDCRFADKNTGYTALHYAVEKQSPSMLSVILSPDNLSSDFVKSSVREALLIKNARGETPLALACTDSDPKMVKKLCNAVVKCYGEEMLNKCLTEENIAEPTLQLDQFRSDDILSPTKDVYVHAARSTLPLSPVHNAIRNNSIKILKSIFEATKSKEFLHQKSSEGLNSCHLAVLHCDAATVKFVIENATSEQINDPGANGITPLHLACLQDRMNVLKELVSNQNLDINQKMGGEENTVLHAAVYRGDHSLLKSILSHSKINVNVKNAEGKTPLHIATELGDVKVVKALCKAGADVNVVDNNGKSPMFSAIVPTNSEKNIVDMLHILKSAKLDVGGDKNDILERCIECKYNKVLDALISSGVRVNNESSISPVVRATQYRNSHAVSKLVSAGGDVDSVVTKEGTEHSGYSLLMLAVNNHDLRTVNTLLSNGCDASVSGPGGKTACHILLDSNNMNFVETVLKAIATKSSANLPKIFSRQDINGDTPLHLAMKKSNTKAAAKMVKSLHKTDLADISVSQNKDGNTLLHLAVQEGNYEFAKLLISSIGSKVALGHIASVKNEKGDTPLHLAIKNGDAKLAKLILNNVNKKKLPDLISAKDEKGNTPIHQALITDISGNDKGFVSLIKMMTNNVSRHTLKDIANDRNGNGDTLAHLALLSGSNFANKFIGLCDENVFLVPNNDNKLLSDCIGIDSKFMQRRAYGFVRSISDKVKTLEEKARTSNYGSYSSSMNTTSSGSESFEVEKDSQKQEKQKQTKLPDGRARLESASSFVSGISSDFDRASSTDESKGPSSLDTSSISGRSSSLTASTISLSSEPSTVSEQSTSTDHASEFEKVFDTKEQAQQFNEDLESIVSRIDSNFISAGEVESGAVSPSAGQKASDKKSTCHSK